MKKMNSSIKICCNINNNFISKKAFFDNDCLKFKAKELHNKTVIPIKNIDIEDCLQVKTSRCDIDDNIISIKKVKIRNNIRVKDLSVKIINKITDIDIYPGPYIAIPTNVDQNFICANMAMEENFVIKEVPN